MAAVGIGAGPGPAVLAPTPRMPSAPQEKNALKFATLFRVGITGDVGHDVDRCGAVAPSPRSTVMLYVS